GVVLCSDDHPEDLMREVQAAGSGHDATSEAPERGATPGKTSLSQQMIGGASPAQEPAARAPASTSGSGGARDSAFVSLLAGVSAGDGDQATRGLASGKPKEREAVRGIGDTLSDIGDVVGTGVGNVVGAVAGAVTGITISSATNAGPTFGPQGAAMWHVAFATTGRTGWIVQKIDNTV